MKLADDLSKRLQELTAGFASRFLDPVLHPYVLALCRTVERSRTLDASKGALEVWAAAVIYIIAQVNLILADQTAYREFLKTLHDHFNTKHHAVYQRAMMIMEKSRIEVGDPRFALPEVTEQLMVYELSNGLQIPKIILDRYLDRPILNEQDVEEAVDNFLKQNRQDGQFEMGIRQQRMKEREEAEKARKEKARQRRAEKHRDQMGLFEDDN